MENKGQSSALGLGIGMVFLVVVLALFATIEPLKESLDDVRGTSSLNCPGTTDFNQTAFEEDNTLNRLTRRPTCFVTGISMVWYVTAVLFAGLAWVVKNWRGA